ncbi:MAG: hypothetical protein JWN44_6395 [Myxococcales bacterium]|nr:hypothetical protein [Myxococcales bacterium]
MRKTPVVLGTLSVIFGSLVGAWSLLAFFIGPMMHKLADVTKNLPGQGELQAAQMEVATKQLEGQHGYMMASATVFLIMSALLAVIGVGLYRRRAWSRRAALYWSVVGLVELVANIVFQVTWLQPRQRAIQDAVYATHNVVPPFQLGSGAQTGMLAAGMLLYAAFPVVLLILLGRRSAEHDFNPPTPAA